MLRNTYFAILNYKLTKQEFLMFTAQEARVMAENSHSHVIRYLDDKVFPHIKKAASEGHREVFVLIDAQPKYRNISVSSIVQGACQLLRSEGGYTVNVGYHGDRYIPKGRQDEPGAESVTNYGIKIQW